MSLRCRYEGQDDVTFTLYSNGVAKHSVIEYMQFKILIYDKKLFAETMAEDACNL